MECLPVRQSRPARRVVSLRWRKDRRRPPAQTLAMTTRRLLALLLVMMVVTVAMARGRRTAGLDEDSRTFAVIGTVTAAPADGNVMVAHEEIAGYMPAMTMPFAVDRQAVPAVRPGDKVRFTLRVAESWSRAEAFTVVGHDARVAAAVGAPAASAPRLRRGNAVPTFALVDEHGAAFTAEDLKGRLTAVTFIFTRCPLPEFCPLMSKRFQQVQRDIANDPSLDEVRLVSITLDPAFDTPAVLSSYAKAYGADPARWRFLTGPEAEIGRLTTAFAIHTARNGVFLDHTLATAVIDRDGTIVEIWRGTGWTAAQIVAALRTASGASTRSD
jgi:protein SCO1/2